MITIAEIQRHVGDYYKIPKPDMVGPGRCRQLAHPRMIAMTLCRDLTGASLQRIGARFGGRDHTTVLHALRRVPTLSLKYHVDLARLRAVIINANEVGTDDPQR